MNRKKFAMGMVLLIVLVGFFLLWNKAGRTFLPDSFFPSKSSKLSESSPVPVPVFSPNPQTGVNAAGRKKEFLVKSQVVETQDRPWDSSGRMKRISVLKVSSKYPFVRVEEEFEKDSKDGSEKLVKRTEMAADHFLIHLKSSKNDQALALLNQKFGTHTLKKLLAKGTYLIQLPSPSIEKFDQTLKSFSRNGKVLFYAEPDFIVHASLTPNDALFSQLWGMNNTGQTGGSFDADIDAPEAWNYSQGSKNVLVGVIDSGIDYNHPDLAANIWTNPGEIPGNGIDDDGNGFVDDVHGWDFDRDDNDPLDELYHGTHCAGTIGAVGNNGFGVAGVCWNVTMVPLKFLSSEGWGYYSDAIDAVYYSVGIGAFLTSNSWGSTSYSQGLKDAIDYANQNGCLFVAAAMNDGVNLDRSPGYPGGYDSPNIISVAALDASDKLASFSNYGLTSVDLGAPGVSILSTFPMYSTPAMDEYHIPPGYGKISGTSMATPHVAGVCALLKALHPEYTSDQVRGIVLASTYPISSLSGKCVTGGRLNAANALNFSIGSQTITGRVIDATTQQPISGAMVSLSGSSKSGVETGNNGSYSFTVPTGVYSIYAWKSGYPYSQSKTLRVPPGSSGIDFALTKGFLVNTPTNLKIIVPPYDSGIHLDWVDQSNNEKEFQIERKRRGDSSWTKITSVGPNVISYTDNTVSPGTHYSYRVRAAKDSDFSDYSNQVDGITPGY